MSSTFDPTAFMNMTVEGSNSTESLPVPEGEYLAISEKVDVVPWSSKDGSNSGLKLQVIWDIQDDGVKSLMERSKVTQRQDIMLDLTETGQLDMGKGKNVGLGRLREAVDLNQAGQPFSFAMLQGRMGKVLVKHRAGTEPGQVFSEVKAVAKPA
jgi:hypothetical protein